jgi:hypothetical protein
MSPGMTDVWQTIVRLAGRFEVNRPVRASRGRQSA